MKKIISYWDLHDFCRNYGRVTPHLNGRGTEFTSFHCEDRSHDPSETINCSEGIGSCYATMVGILTMRGYIVEFSGEDDLLFCTADELEKLKEESSIVEKEEDENSERNSPEHPARPKGIKITREIQVTTYKAYEQCQDYKSKRSTLFFNNLTLQSRYSSVCKEDCIFPTCPFYSKWAVDSLAYQHRDDYDEWIVEAYKKLQG